MLKRSKAALLVLPAAIISLPALAQASADLLAPRLELGLGNMIFGSQMMILPWVGIVLLIALAVRWRGGRFSQSPLPSIARKTAVDILHERFARGELDKEEFEARRHALTD